MVLFASSLLFKLEMSCCGYRGIFWGSTILGGNSGEDSPNVWCLLFKI